MSAGASKQHLPRGSMASPSGTPKPSYRRPGYDPVATLDTNKPDGKKWVPGLGDVAVVADPQTPMRLRSTTDAGAVNNGAGDGSGSNVIVVGAEGRKVDSHHFLNTPTSTFKHRRVEVINNKQYRRFVPPTTQHMLKFKNLEKLPGQLDQLWGKSEYVPLLLKKFDVAREIADRQRALIGVLTKLKNVMTTHSMSKVNKSRTAAWFWLHPLEKVPEEKEEEETSGDEGRHAGRVNQQESGEEEAGEASEEVEMDAEDTSDEAAVCMKYDVARVKRAAYMHASSKGYLRLVLGRVAKVSRNSRRKLPVHKMKTRGAKSREVKRDKAKLSKPPPPALAGTRRTNQTVGIDAHRLLAWMIHGGPPGDQIDYDVHHTCGEPKCLNPFHLEWILKKDHATLHLKARGANGG